MGRDRDLQLVLVRFSGDVSTKARATRFQFVQRLVRNLRDALAAEGVTPRIRVSHNRIFVELPPGGPIEPLTRVFGVQSISPVERRSGTGLQEIVTAGEALYRDRVAGRRFAVRARRVGSREKIATGARELERALGTALLPGSAGVDLDDPEQTVYVELLEGETCFFPERIPAHGGLPLGVGGDALALVSGGFDSAVAAWQLLKRGVALDYLFCNLGGTTHEHGVLRVIKVLADRWSYGTRPRLHAVDFAPVVQELQQRTLKRYWQVLLKRLMLRAAERVATETRAAALVTGEAVGQVSSQTLQNLTVISQATPMTILRPLVGFNKDEIIAVAERIGTFDLSKVVGEYCAMVPRRPATRASSSAVLEEESKLDLSCVERAVETRSAYELRSLDLEKLELPGLEIDIESAPEGATLIDLRSQAQFRASHHPGAVRLDFARALQSYPSFDRDRPYVLYCEIGLKSAHLAELMRKQGFEAYYARRARR